MDEIWKTIDGYGGKYLVSNIGRVWSEKTKRIMKPHYRKGYTFVLLSDGKKGSSHYSIHRLVCAAFLGKSDLHVDHKNGKKDDNRLENLHYVTHRQNHILYHQKTKDGISGVRKRTNCSSWEATANFQGKSLHLGNYKTEAEAVAARQAFLITENAITRAAALAAIAKIKED